MTARRDDDAAIQVVEAILVAVLVASALIFFALTQRPSVPPAGPATDLAQVASDTLVILQGSAPGHPDTDTLQDHVQTFLATDDPTTCPTSGAGAFAAAKSDLVGLLPDGMQFRLQATTDGATTLLACSSTGSPGSGAQAGVAYVVVAGELYRVELVVWDVF